MNHGRLSLLNVGNPLSVPRLSLSWRGSMQSFRKEETIFLRYMVLQCLNITAQTVINF